MAFISLFDIIKRDAKHIINKGGYQLSIQLTTKLGDRTISISGWAVKITGAFDTDGNQVNTKNVHVTIDEDALIKLDYSFRTSRKGISEVDLQDHKVSFIDSSGLACNYIVTQTVPDENLGLITLQLGDYKLY